MNEVLRSLGFDQVSNTKWTNGGNMMIFVNCTNNDLTCFGDVGHDNDYVIEIEYIVSCTDLETTKNHIEKFMRMVGKCIQIDEE